MTEITSSSRKGSSAHEFPPETFPKKYNLLQLYILRLNRISFVLFILLLKAERMESNAVFSRIECHHPLLIDIAIPEEYHEHTPLIWFDINEMK